MIWPKIKRKLTDFIVNIVNKNMDIFPVAEKEQRIIDSGKYVRTAAVESGI